MRKVFVLGFLLFCLMPTCISQNSFKLDRPRIKNFSKSIYHADNQNWSLGQDKVGTLYFGNSQGLLIFNGVSWNLFPLPKNTIARSVEVTESGKVFVGSYEEFGFFEKDINGSMHYTSLKNLLKNFIFHNEDIWKIITINGITYFQSFSVIFAYNGREVEVLQPPGLISCFANIEGQLLLIISGRGLYKLKDSKIIGIDSSEVFRNQMIRVLLPYNQNKMLVASADNGIYTYDFKGNFKPWGNGGETGYINSSINRGVVSKEGIIIGTILNGIYAFDTTGNIIYHINKQNGLQNNTVLGELIDADGYLWVGLDNGIDLINPGSTVTFYYDQTGNLGSVYTVIVKNGLLYAGTNQGLFYSKFLPSEGNIKLDFKLIENSQGQVWSLFEFNNQLFCGHNDRTYEILENKIIPLAPVSGGFSFCELRHNSEDYLIQCTYTDLVIFKKQHGRWVFSHKIQNFLNPVRFIEVDHLGNIWASHLQRGIFRLRLSEDLTKIAETEYYGINKGFLSDYHISVFKLQNRAVFTNEGRVFIYNDLTDTIVKFDFVEEQIRKNSLVNSIIYAGNKNYWFITDKTLDLYEFSTGKVLLKKTYSFEFFDNKLIRNNEYIYPIDSSRWIVCLENGIALINSGGEQNVLPAKKTLINKVVSQGGKEIVISNGTESNTKPVSLIYSQNSLIFYFSCPVYDSKISFYVKLDGIDKEWNPIDLAYCKYDRLPWGNYTFNVKAMDGKGNFSQVSSFKFIVRSPWYWSFWFQIFYAITVAVLFIFMRRYFFTRLKNTEKRIRIQKERELIRIKNDKLQSEIHYKSMQLANTTYAITKKNELLLEIKKLLSKGSRNTDLKNPFKEVHKLLDQNITNEDDWKIFESNFEQAHEEFLQRIKKQYINLTPSDLKLCAFIRMNLPSKRIAPLLGISIRGVENHRHRLRKKMELDRDVNLTDYLMSF